MLARTISYITLGLEALPVEVEVDAGRGLPVFTIIGLADTVVKEARERVRTALLNSQFHLPSLRLTVNLAPADLKKEGGNFDLAMALGILAASGQLDPAALASAIVLGELALDGTIRPVHGILPIALSLKSCRRPILIPAANAAEASVVKQLRFVPVRTLQEAVESLSGTRTCPAIPKTFSSFKATPQTELDFADVKGQAHAKRALEIAAAGGHHALLIGPPGSGKTMLASRIPGIQPDLPLAEALEVTAIHSIAGMLNGGGLIRQRPFRAPHHTASAAALVGGGTFPKPGEASLAHQGVLFLDELPEFRRDVLESLRQPLEEGVIRVARAKRTLTFPSRFMLVAAMNPCPCGYLTQNNGRCRCPSTRVANYLGKISGPLLDRIDLHIDVPAVPFDLLIQPVKEESSAQIKSRVLKARRRQVRRFKQSGIACNARLRHRDLKTACSLSPKAALLMKSAMQELRLSARSYGKVLKIARTVADLAGADSIEENHLAEALQYRSLDRMLWT